MGMSSELELLAPEYNVPVFTDIFPSADDFVSFYRDTGLLETEITDAFLNRTWFYIYARYGNDPIAGADINQWMYRLLEKLNAYAPTYIKKDDIQKKLRALSDDDIREGYKTIFNHAINPSKAPSTDNTNELPYISDQNVNKTRKNKTDAYLTLWDALRSNLLEEFIGRFKPLFSKIVATTDRLIYFGEN